MTAIAARAEAQRTGMLLGRHHRRIGQIAVYRGDPSWVFMNIEGSAHDGRAVCRLQAHNGATVVSGIFEVDNGSGQFAQALRLDIKKLRRAEIITATGVTVATAILS